MYKCPRNEQFRRIKKEENENTNQLPMNLHISRILIPNLATNNFKQFLQTFNYPNIKRIVTSRKHHNEIYYFLLLQNIRQPNSFTPIHRSIHPRSETTIEKRGETLGDRESTLPRLNRSEHLVAFLLYRGEDLVGARGVRA